MRPYHRPLSLGAKSLEVLGLPVPPDDCGCGCMKYTLGAVELGGSYGTSPGIGLVALVERDEDEVVELSLSDALARLFADGGVGGIDSSADLRRVAAALSGAHCVQVGTPTSMPRSRRSRTSLGASPPRSTWSRSRSTVARSSTSTVRR